MKHKRLKNCYCRLDGWLPLSCNLSMITQIDNVIISISGVIDNHNRLHQPKSNLRNNS